MPLLGKKVFQLAKPMCFLPVDASVFVIEHTGEFFQSKQEYDKRNRLYSERVWTCQSTGHVNLTHQEAWKSEQEAIQNLKKNFPECMEKPILEIVHHSTCSLDVLVDCAYVKVNSMFFPGDLVQFKVKHGGRVIRGWILSVEEAVNAKTSKAGNNKENAASASSNCNENTPRKSPPKLLPYNYNIRLVEEDKIISAVPSADLVRAERPPCKDLIRLFVRSHALRHGTHPNSPWIVESKLVRKYSLPSKFADFLLSSKSLERTEIKSGKRSLQDATSPSKKKRLKLELKPLTSQVILNGSPKHSSVKRNDVAGSPKVKKTVVKKAKKKDMQTKIGFKDEGVTSVKKEAVDETKSNETASLDHSYSSSPKLEQNGGSTTPKKQAKVGKANSSSRSKDSSKTSAKATKLVKRKKDAERKPNGASSSEKRPLEVTKSNKPSTSKHKVDNSKNQKLKQITLHELSSKKLKKTPVKVQDKLNSTTSLSSPGKGPGKNEHAPSKPLTLMAPSAYSHVIKKITTLVKADKKQQAYHYIRRLSQIIKPHQYADLPEDVRVLVLRRIAWQEEQEKLSKMNEQEKKEYLKLKRMNLKKQRIESMKGKENEGVAKPPSLEPLEKYEDQQLSLKPLPAPELVSTPDNVPNELFGDVVMVVEFISCYSGLLMPGEPYPISTDFLLRSISSGNEGFGYLSRILLILLQTLLQDRIAEEYKELGVRISDLPINIFTSSELVRLCLRKRDELNALHNNEAAIASNNETDELDDAPEDVLSLLETVEMYELSPGEKLKILTGLCHRIMNSYSVQEYMEQKLKGATQFWNERRKEKSKKPTKDKESTMTTEETTKEEASSGTSNGKDAGEQPEKEVKEAANEASDKGAEDSLVSTVKRRRILTKEMMLEREKKQKEEEARRLKEAEEQKKQKEKETFDRKFREAMVKAKLTLRNTPLGYDRNHSRYWVFTQGTPGLYLEKGWACDSMDYSVGINSMKAKNSESDSDDEPLILYVAKGDKSIPPRGQNLWFHYNTTKEFEDLLEALGKQGIRESDLLKKMKFAYDDICRSINAKKLPPRVEIKPSSGSVELLEGFRKELSETEVRLRKGFLGGVPDFDEWNSQLQDASGIRELGSRLLETHSNVFPRFLKGAMKVKINPATGNPEATDPSSKHFTELWKLCVENCTTMSRLHVLLGVLDACIMWEKSTLNAKCKICRKKDEDDMLILCDSCNFAYHLCCLRPRLEEVPQGDWLCPVCKPPSERQSDRSVNLRRREDESNPQYKEAETESSSSDESESEEIETEKEKEKEEKYDKNYEPECTLCGGDEDVISCSCCHLGYHTFCHEPPLRKKPCGTWKCASCKSDKKPKNVKKGKKRRTCSPKASDQKRTRKIAWRGSNSRTTKEKTGHLSNCRRSSRLRSLT